MCASRASRIYAPEPQRLPNFTALEARAHWRPRPHTRPLPLARASAVPPRPLAQLALHPLHPMSLRAFAASAEAHDPSVQRSPPPNAYLTSQARRSQSQASVGAVPSCAQSAGPGRDERRDLPHRPRTTLPAPLLPRCRPGPRVLLVSRWASRAPGADAAAARMPGALCTHAWPRAEPPFLMPRPLTWPLAR